MMTNDMEAGWKVRHTYTGIEYEILKTWTNGSSKAVITKVPREKLNYADVGESFNVWPDFMERIK